MKRKTQLGQVRAPSLKMIGEPCKKVTKRPHQQQNRALNGNLYHALLSDVCQETYLGPER
jgi:hypothetical protein